MKKVMSIVIAILVVAALTVGAGAEAMTASAPSPTMSPSLLTPMVVGAVVYDAEGNVVAEDVTADIFVSMGEDDEVAAEALIAAYESLIAAGSVEAVCPELAGMEIRDLLYISASDEVAAFLANGGSVVLTLDMQVEADITLAAMHFDGASWTACPDGTMTVYANGDVDMVVTTLGVFALLVA